MWDQAQLVMWVLAITISLPVTQQTLSHTAFPAPDVGIQPKISISEGWGVDALTQSKGESGKGKTEGMS